MTKRDELGGEIWGLLRAGLTAGAIGLILGALDVERFESWSAYGTAMGVVVGITALVALIWTRPAGS